MRWRHSHQTLSMQNFLAIVTERGHIAQRFALFWSKTSATSRTMRYGALFAGIRVRRILSQVAVCLIYNLHWILLFAIHHTVRQLIYSVRILLSSVILSWEYSDNYLPLSFHYPYAENEMNDFEWKTTWNDRGRFLMIKMKKDLQ